MIWSSTAMGRIQLRSCSRARLTCLPCWTLTWHSRMQCNFCAVSLIRKKMNLTGRHTWAPKCWLSWQRSVSHDFKLFLKWPRNSDNELIGVPFSVIAAAALKQSMNTCQPELVWDADLCYWTGFTSANIEIIVNHMAKLVKMAARSGSRKPMGKVAGRHRRALPSFRLAEWYFFLTVQKIKTNHSHVCFVFATIIYCSLFLVCFCCLSYE